MLLLQDEALDSVIRWESDLDPSVRGIKKKVTEVLKIDAFCVYSRMNEGT
jgi:hypothetical protein